MKEDPAKNRKGLAAAKLSVAQEEVKKEELDDSRQKKSAEESTDKETAVLNQEDEKKDKVLVGDNDEEAMEVSDVEVGTWCHWCWFYPRKQHMDL